MGDWSGLTGPTVVVFSSLLGFGAHDVMDGGGVITRGCGQEQAEMLVHLFRQKGREGCLGCDKIAIF